MAVPIVYRDSVSTRKDPLMQPSQSIPNHPPRMDHDSVHATLRAARHGAHAYPGPVGELIRRGASALAPRLIAFLTATEEQEVARPANPWAHLPARYRPGSPLQWDYNTEQRGTDQPPPHTS